jgi:hypothetical protein
MQMDLFSLGDEEMAEFRNNMEETVNEAIMEALRKNLYSADVSIKISVKLGSENTVDGQVCFVPEYDYKSGYKIGGKYDGEKGKFKGKVGIRFGKDGYVDSVLMPEQMKIAE